MGSESASPGRPRRPSTAATDASRSPLRSRPPEKDLLRAGSSRPSSPPRFPSSRLSSAVGHPSTPSPSYNFDRFERRPSTALTSSTLAADSPVPLGPTPLPSLLGESAAPPAPAARQQQPAGSGSEAQPQYWYNEELQTAWRDLGVAVEKAFSTGGCSRRALLLGAISGYCYIYVA